MGSLVRRFAELVRSPTPDDRTLGVDSLLLLSEQTLAVQAMLESDSSIAQFLVGLCRSAADVHEDVPSGSDRKLRAPSAEALQLSVLRLLTVFSSHVLGCDQLVSDVRILSSLLDAAGRSASAEATVAVAQIFQKLLLRPHSAVVVVHGVGGPLVRFLTLMLSSLDDSQCDASLAALLRVALDAEHGRPLLVCTLGCVEMCLEVTKSTNAPQVLTAALQVLACVTEVEEGAVQCVDVDGSAARLLGLLAFPLVPVVQLTAESLCNLARWQRGREVISACPHAVRTLAAGLWSPDGCTVRALLAALRPICAHPACAADAVAVPRLAQRLAAVLAEPCAVAATSAAALLASLAEHPAGVCACKQACARASHACMHACVREVFF